METQKGILPMDIITHSQRYLPHELSTRIHAVKLYRSNHFSIKEITRRYKISKASLMRWNKRYDGTKASLMDKSHRPHTTHPNAHTENELKHIKNLIKRNPTISLYELFGKLRRKHQYKRHVTSLYRVLRKLGYYLKADKKIKRYIPKPYHTPCYIGEKMQLDVKHIPKTCASVATSLRFYQYTMIDEATRERFIYAYEEYSTYSTIDFVNRAIRYFGYLPKIIQTDNGSEFTYPQKTKKIHPLDQWCKKYHIIHQLIRPRTPRHNGKVERSHRNDNQRFYQFLKFYSFEDLQYQMKQYLKRSNDIPMQVLGYQSPKEYRKYLEQLYGKPTAIGILK